MGVKAREEQKHSDTKPPDVLWIKVGSKYKIKDKLVAQQLVSLKVAYSNTF